MNIHLTAHFEKLVPPGAFQQLASQTLLYHQVRTADALQHASLVVNSYNTGTGKTRASLLYLFTLGKRHQNVLFIAPTNALIQQHVEDIQKFVNEHNLPFRVIEVNADVVRRLGVDLAVAPRSGEKLHRLLRNPLEFHGDLGITPDDHRSLPFIIVVNPDIFHYMLFLRYAYHDQRNLFDDVIKTFWYVVIDEFHYYDEKQLVSFLAFLALWQEWGYFGEGRKVCLLSATPNPQVEAYLTGILGNTWMHVSPDNEPPESVNYKQIQTLSELNLEISEAALDEWLKQRRADLNIWLQAGEDGAIISNSLARINDAFELLRDLDVCRLTGPEPPERRAQALQHQLLLATPVVDIGYNFDRDKPRQNIDFVVCEGRYRDDLVQRIGRAGRVLGKPQCDCLSHAVVLVSNEAAEALRPYDGQRFDRRQFRDLLNTMDKLPPKHRLDAYIRIHGMTEVFYPIYRAGVVMHPDERDAEVERLYESIRTVFASNSRRSQQSLSAFFRAFDARERWWHAKESEKWNCNGWYEKTLIDNLANWLSKLRSDSGKDVRVTRDEARKMLVQVLNSPRQREGLRAFIAGQYHLTKSLFAFRDSFNSPKAVLYDPEHLFSSVEHNTYDLFHLAANYQLHLYEDWKEFQAHCGETDLRGDFYVRLLGRLNPRLHIEFSLDSDVVEQAVFNRHFCQCPVSLNGIKLIARQVKGDYMPIPPVVQDAIREMYLTLLIVPREDQGMLLSVLRGTPLIARPLTVRFGNGTQAAYSAVAGSAAWHAEATLHGHFLMRQRREPCEAIFV